MFKSKISSASSAEFIYRFSDISKKSSNRIILSGSSVLASLQPLVPDNLARIKGFTQTSKTAAFSFKKKVKTVFMSIQKDILAEILKNGDRIVIAAEIYIEWGSKEKGRVILLSGDDPSVSDSESNNIEAYVFNNGDLIEIISKTLPALNVSYFKEAADSVLESLVAGHSDYRIVQSFPKKGVDFSETRSGVVVENLDLVSLLGKSKYYPIGHYLTSKRDNFILPFVLGGAGIAVYAILIFLGWRHYSTAVLTFNEVSDDPIIQKRGGIDTGMLQAFEQRKVFIDRIRPQEKIVADIRLVIASISLVEDVRLNSIELPPLSAMNSTKVTKEIPEGGVTTSFKPDFLIELSAPIMIDTGALEQGRMLLDSISAKSGLSLRTVQVGWWRDSDDRRIFVIEGEMPSNKKDIAK